MFYICINIIYMLSIQQMHYILVLSEELQFQRASERCFVTQPTLSMQVKKAEEILGHPIFDRSRNPIELTPFGNSLLPIIREVVNETNKIDHLLERLKGNYKEVIKIGVIPTIASYLVPDMFQKWQERIGNIQLTIEELKTEELIVAMEKKNWILRFWLGHSMTIVCAQFHCSRKKFWRMFQVIKRKGFLLKN